MILINFSHPDTESQRNDIATLAGMEIENVIRLPVHFDPDQSYITQISSLVDQVPFSPDEWQKGNYLIIPPSQSALAVVLLAELDARSGHLPSIVRLKPVINSPLPAFEVAEIINLQSIRTISRPKRFD